MGTSVLQNQWHLADFLCHIWLHNIYVVKITKIMMNKMAFPENTGVLATHWGCCFVWACGTNLHVNMEKGLLEVEKLKPWFPLAPTSCP